MSSESSYGSLLRQPWMKVCVCVLGLDRRPSDHQTQLCNRSFNKRLFGSGIFQNKSLKPVSWEWSFVFSAFTPGSELCWLKISFWWVWSYIAVVLRQYWCIQRGITVNKETECNICSTQGITIQKYYFLVDLKKTDYKLDQLSCCRKKDKPKFVTLCCCLLLTAH